MINPNLILWNEKNAKIMCVIREYTYVSIDNYGVFATAKDNSRIYLSWYEMCHIIADYMMESDGG